MVLSLSVLIGAQVTSMLAYAFSTLAGLLAYFHFHSTKVKDLYSISSCMCEHKVHIQP
jgi:hypothetical protein